MHLYQKAPSSALLCLGVKYRATLCFRERIQLFLIFSMQMTTCLCVWSLKKYKMAETVYCLRTI